MKIIPLINEITNSFNEIFKNNLNPLNLESKIRNVGDLFTLKLYESFLNYFDDQFKINKERKCKYNIKETRKRTLITSIGVITIKSTSYIDKETKEYYVPLRDILHLKPYQRLTNEAEYQLIKYSMGENMSQAARYALRNTQVSRSTVSKKIKVLNGSINETIIRCTNQPDILYIEMDEIHANLQNGENKICPCAIVHEGYEEDFVKRKKLKNVRYFASSKLTYEELWEVIFDYVNKKYDIDKFKVIFVSGDGAPGIKNYTNCFPHAKFVLDSFHYIRKHLNYIFKNDIENFPVYLLTGTILFSFFQEAVGQGLTSILANASLITKVYMPKYIYPVTKVVSTSINLLISMIPLLIVTVLTGEPITPAFLLLPFALFCLVLFCIGFSLMLSAAMVFFRDTQYLWGIASLIWMYATPLFYPENIIPEEYQIIQKINPLYHIVKFARVILIEGVSPEPRRYLYCLVSAVAVCLIGAVIFKKSQDKFILYI